jgi:anaerobic magnesium-protoporphyrin IX monomethyl ester cyclase
MKILFLDADEPGMWYNPNYGPHERWQDHGMGELATMARLKGVDITCATPKGMHSKAQVRQYIRNGGFDTIAMNVRSWRYQWAVLYAKIAKTVNPNIRVWTGGFHSTVAPLDMVKVDEFDVIVQGEAEGTWEELLDGAYAEGRSVVRGSVGRYKHLDDIPYIDRSLWPQLPVPEVWPLEETANWGPGRAATIITGRRCPWRCKFCWPAEWQHYHAGLRRRSVGSIIEELNYIERKWGPIGTVIFHDAEWLMQKEWLEEFLDCYPRETPNWPFWASARSDMIAKWPALVSALVREANWHCISIGFESGSDRVLNDILGKQTTVAKHMEAIEIVNHLGDEMEAEGRQVPKVFANMISAIPGETREEAFATMRLLKEIKRVIPSFSWYTPYPGNDMAVALEEAGRVIGGEHQYERWPGIPKVRGVDYNFYMMLHQGAYDDEIGISALNVMLSQGSPGIGVDGV